MSAISKAVIPAAGSGKRMYPISKYLPKPMLPLGKKPVLQHIIEELEEAGIDEIAIVARTEHQAIFEYFGRDPAITIVEDNTASGPGGAILKAEEFVDGEDFMVVFCDAPVMGAGRSDHLKRLIEAKYKYEAKAALSIYQIPRDEISSRGVVTFVDQEPGGEVVELDDMLEKPPKNSVESQWASACRYILDADIIEALREVEIEKGERQLTPAIRQLLHKGHSVVGLPIPENLHRYDTGNFEGYFEAFNNFAEQ